MYYICKFSSSWSIYEVKKGTSRPLEKSEIDCLETLFPELLKNETKILTALQISSIQPNKLLNLPVPEKNETVKRS
jgi:hypothetical protein